MTLAIRTRDGVLEGGHSERGRHWLGIPYARAERFGLPLPPAAWSGTRSATAFGPECPQYFGAMASEKKIDGPGVSEDCLVLNIWAPATTDSALKPVMMWIHGGAFMAGTGNTYDGGDLSARGDIVVVTINYRLGVLGFANLGEALETAQIPSNLGVRDQIAALEWIRGNIAAFGGDPQRVTIAGESAGSIAVSMLMHCPTAWPLFQGAILESGAISLLHNRERSLRIGHHYREILNLRSHDLDQLRSLDLKTLLKAQSKVQALERGTVPAAPWFDGDLVPSSLSDARAAATANVPLLAGFNRDEIRTFEWIKGPDILPMTRGANELLIRQQLSQSAADQVLGAYPDTKQGNRALATHLTFGMPTLHFAERHSQRNPTWFYRFDCAHFMIGAAHGLELPFVWNFKGPLGVLARGGLLIGKRRALTRRMQQHWAHFVRHGRPEADWPAFTTQERCVRLFNLDDQMARDPDQPQRQAWNGADVSTNVAVA
jgi:para-nitrobenzyl esterase